MKRALFLIVLLVLTNLVSANEDAEKGLSHEVYFNTDAYTITADEFQKLLGFIETIKDIDSDRISIHGFCDDRGNAEYNLALSSKRAHAIKNVITRYRKNKDLHVDVNGKGEIKLSTEEQALFDELRSMNRKVTIVVAPKKLIAGSFYGEDLETGDLINISSLNFKMGLRYLTPESTAALKELAAFLVKRQDIYFTVNGHVCCTDAGRDSRDKETGKRNLSVVRAKFIHDYLVKQGVATSRIKYQGLKGQYNLNKEDKDDRRVDLLVRYISK